MGALGESGLGVWPGVLVGQWVSRWAGLGLLVGLGVFKHAALVVVGPDGDFGW